MLNSLTYSVTFPTTGRQLANSIDFQSGFGSITGPNEAGKTFVIEMVRYCLFGTAALRYKAETYQRLMATLVFTVRGETYKVVRDRSPKLFRGDVEIAVGTRPINEKIIQILGYGLDVFDVANVANQGDLEKLGNMRPTDRKRMVDNVIGLGVIEDLTKWAADQANGFNREADAIESVMRQPVEPTKPTVTATVEEVRALEALDAELNQLRGALSVVVPAPVEPVHDGSPLSTQELTDLARREVETAFQLNQLRKRLAELPQPSVYDDRSLQLILEAHDLADDWEAWSRLPKRSHTIEQLNQMISDGLLIAEHEQQDRIRHRLSKEDHHTCPACEHRFPADPDEVAQLQAQLVDLPPKPEPPALSLIAANNQLRIPDAPPEPRKVERPSLSRKQVVAFQMANARAAERAQIEAEIASIDVSTGYVAASKARQAYEAAMMAHLKDVAAYARWEVEQDARRARAAELETLVAPLAEKKLALALAQAYERDLEVYVREQVTFMEQSERVAELRSKVDGWRKARASLITLRLLVKQHLLPSLNKVASNLISNMTGGQRQSVIVDDDFEVTVDGQALDTLSGSGKSVANLALRLGLGQVLTNNVFSVFIGDEIDAFMDADRAENTSNTLRLLKFSISQILLVTHKYPSADFYIDVGNNARQSD